MLQVLQLMPSRLFKDHLVGHTSPLPMNFLSYRSHLRLFRHKYNFSLSACPSTITDMLLWRIPMTKAGTPSLVMMSGILT
jgi:hypothetical protein